MIKIFKKTLIITLVLSFSIIAIIPLDTKADSKANNIAELKEELAELKRQKNSNAADKSKTQSSINSKKQAIYDAYNQKTQAENDITIANEKIAESEIKIKDVTSDTEEILRLYQLMSNDKSMFLEYITEADSLSDMSMRVKAIELITDYYQEELKTLEQLIKENEALKVELEQKKVQLDGAIVNYNNAIAQLDNYMDELEDVGDDINAQIKNQQILINYYQSICSSETQPLSDCVKVLASSRFIRPLDKGVVTSNFGSRINPLTGKASSMHYGIDVADGKGGSKVYAAANGMVAAVSYKSSCGGNIVYIHHNVAGVAYTTQYAHLLRVNVKVGDTVTANDVIGYVGGGGSTLKKNGGWDTCSTGYHLHFAIAKGHYLGGGTSGYSSYSKFKASMINPGSYFPSKGVWFYKRF